jgi:hypothetical protein
MTTHSVRQYVTVQDKLKYYKPWRKSMKLDPMMRDLGSNEILMSLKAWNKWLLSSMVPRYVARLMASRASCVNSQQNVDWQHGPYQVKTSEMRTYSRDQRNDGAFWRFKWRMECNSCQFHWKNPKCWFFVAWRSTTNTCPMSTCFFSPGLTRGHLVSNTLCGRCQLLISFTQDARHLGTCWGIAVQGISQQSVTSYASLWKCWWPLSHDRRRVKLHVRLDDAILFYQKYVRGARYTLVGIKAEFGVWKRSRNVPVNCRQIGEKLRILTIQIQEYVVGQFVRCCVRSWNGTWPRLRL